MSRSGRQESMRRRAIAPSKSRECANGARERRDKKSGVEQWSSGVSRVIFDSYSTAPLLHLLLYFRISRRRNRSRYSSGLIRLT